MPFLVLAPTTSFSITDDLFTVMWSPFNENGKPITSHSIFVANSVDSDYHKVDCESSSAVNQCLVKFENVKQTPWSLKIGD